MPVAQSLGHGAGAGPRSPPPAADPSATFDTKRRRATPRGAVDLLRLTPDADVFWKRLLQGKPGTESISRTRPVFPSAWRGSIDFGRALNHEEWKQGALLRAFLRGSSRVRAEVRIPSCPHQHVKPIALHSASDRLMTARTCRAGACQIESWGCPLPPSCSWQRHERGDEA